MDKHTLENWQRIKVHLENVGQTENHFYKRACKICEGKPDPMPEPFGRNAGEDD